MLSPLGLERMLGSMDRFWRRSGIDGAAWTEFSGANGIGLRALSPVLGLPASSGRAGLLGPSSAPGGLRKFGFAPGGRASDDIGGDSPGLLGGGPGDFGGMGL